MAKVIRPSEREARAIGILLTSVGMVGANALRGFFKIPKKRALELESLKPTKAETAYIVSFLK